MSRVKRCGCGHLVFVHADTYHYAEWHGGNSKLIAPGSCLYHGCPCIEPHDIAEGPALLLAPLNLRDNAGPPAMKGTYDDGLDTEIA